MIVTVWVTSSTTGNVLLFDETTSTGATYAITTNPILWESADFLIEKVCCESSGNPVQLPNYVNDFCGYTWAADFKGHVYGPGTNILSSPRQERDFLLFFTARAGIFLPIRETSKCTTCCSGRFYASMIYLGTSSSTGAGCDMGLWVPLSCITNLVTKRALRVPVQPWFETPR
jgi:hypothetical protein